MPKKERPGVMIYHDLYQPTRRLSDSDKGRLFDAILEYSMFGVVPEFDGMLGVVWDFAQPRIDADKKSYQTKCERSRAAIKKRWEQKEQDSEPTEDDHDVQPDTDVYQRIPPNTDVYGRMPAEDKEGSKIHGRNTDVYERIPPNTDVFFGYQLNTTQLNSAQLNSTQHSSTQLPAYNETGEEKRGGAGGEENQTERRAEPEKVKAFPLHSLPDVMAEPPEITEDRKRQAINAVLSWNG